MSNRYLGMLDYADPLYGIMAAQACPEVPAPCFQVSATSSRSVYRYTEEKTGRAFIGKFFRLDDIGSVRVAQRTAEYENLLRMRELGFDAPPHYVARPLARHEAIGLALIEAYVDGKNLDYYFKRAAFKGEDAAVREKLSRLASFLSALHAKTAQPAAVDLGPVAAYASNVLDALYRYGVLAAAAARRLADLMNLWLAHPLLRGAQRATIHGDATPTNFLFTSEGPGGAVAAIDLERMREGDPAYDVSMVCGEIKHAFLWRGNSAAASEPYIRHFLEAYAAAAPDPAAAFHSFAARNPFYMALTELRIARNAYLDGWYRKRLVAEALACLDGGRRQW